METRTEDAGVVDEDVEARFLGEEGLRGCLDAVDASEV